MSNDKVIFDFEDGLATIRFNDPSTLNAFTADMIEESALFLKKIKTQPEVRALIITGTGRGFSAGQNLMAAGDAIGSADATPSAGLRKYYHPFIKLMLEVDVPVIGVINGVAAGIGMAVALATDIRIASDKAAFTLGFSKIGLVPDGGANWILPRLIGYPRAYQIALSSEKVSAEKALAWGLVNQVVPHDQLMEVATAYALKIAHGPTKAFGMTKMLMRQGMWQSFEDNLENEAFLQDLAAKTEDCAEGVQAFLQKRPAEYKGK